MAVTTDGFRQYLNQSPDSDEDLEVYLNAAKSQLRAAGVPDFQQNALYDMGVMALAAYLHENRGLTFSGTYQDAMEENMRKLLNSLVLELRFAGEDPAGEEDAQ